MAEDDLQRAVSLVEQAITALGVDPATCRLPSEVDARYALTRGSASIVVAVHPPRQDDEDGTVRVVAPVVRLPGEDRRGALYEELLTLNATRLAGAAFGVMPPDVVLVTERSVRDLDASEVDAMIKQVGRVADRYDDVLAREFETTRSSDAS